MRGLATAALLAFALCLALLAGCTSTPTVQPTTASSSSALPESSDPLVACGLSPVADAGFAERSPSFHGPIESVAARVANLTGDTLVQRTRPTTLDPQTWPPSATWDMALGHLTYSRASAADQAVGGLYWPGDSWDTFTNRVWPARTPQAVNATLQPALERLAGLPSGSIHVDARDEPVEGEMEGSILERFGDLPEMSVGHLITSYGMKGNFTSLHLEVPVVLASGQVLPAARLHSVAQAFLDCWAAKQGVTLAAVHEGDATTRASNGTVLGEYAWRTTVDALKKAGCGDIHLAAVLVDARDATVRMVRLSPYTVACLR